LAWSAAPTASIATWASASPTGRVIRPTLTLVDAVRILVDHGPTGGSLNDVKETNTVIASHDLVAADAYGATLFGLAGVDIPFIKAGAEMGLGTLDLKASYRDWSGELRPTGTEMSESINRAIGESIIVKPTVKDPETGFDLGGCGPYFQPTRMIIDLG
jgi:hypothetical protein